MTIADSIAVNTHYTRSVNLERDARSSTVLEGYIPTSRALRTLERVSQVLHEDLEPRAWTLIGPYGSGKSSFALFLAELLGADDAAVRSAALEKITAIDKRLAENLARGLEGKAPMLRVLVTGSPAPMSNQLLSALSRSTEALWQGRRGKRPAVLARMGELVAEGEVSVETFVECVAELQEALARKGVGGILLVIDELGKFLEYEARHYGANDIYLLQALAEHAAAGHACNLLLFANLHQSFEQYARGLGEHLRAEWSKVQGRFEEVPFLESQEQVLRVVAHAFEHALTNEQQGMLEAATARAVEALGDSGALPNSMPKGEALALFTRCYPLSPLSALILPILCQRVAQNERTLFSYLGSHEEYGLQHLLKSFDSVGDCIEPHHLFDYFVSNQSAAIGDYGTHRRWAEVMTAIDRVGDVSADVTAVLKTIGLLNIIGARDGLKASREILSLVLSDRSRLTECLGTLEERSAITFRKFSGEYRVWQGSDFDLETALQESFEQLGDFELAQTLNAGEFLQPLVARRYTIRNGALRYFVPLFVDKFSFRKTKKADKLPRLILYLAANQDDEQTFYDDVSSHFSDLDIVALCRSSVQLRESTREVLGLLDVEQRNQQLASDPVAKREHADRLDAAQRAQQHVLDSLFERPQDNDWYHRGSRVAVTTKRLFQEMLSEVLTKVYRASPTVHNELVNRDKPSSNANAARIKLLHAMLVSPEKTDLGIDKFPPEKAIYRSVLLATGLHKEWNLNEWRFVAPEKSTPFFHVWQRINQFLESTEETPRSFAELNGELMAPPYGVKAGLLPVIYVAVYCVLMHELAIYEQGRFKPKFTGDMLERFVKRPDEFQVQRFRIEGMRASIYQQYMTLFTDNKEKTVIELVRPLAELTSNLDDFTQQTKGHLLRDSTRRVRDAFKLSKSPQALLFNELPIALGFDADSFDAADASLELEGYADMLTEALRELKYAHRELRREFAALLAQSFHMSADTDISELRRQAAGRYDGLEQHTVDVDGVRAFIKRVTKRSGSDEDWLENLLMFLGRKPAGKWTDADRAEAELRLTEFSKRLLDLETLRLHYDKHADKGDADVEVILLKSFRKGGEPVDEVVAIDQARHEAISEVKSEMRAALVQHSDRELQLAILAELVDEVLGGDDAAEHNEDDALRGHANNG